MQRSTQRTTDGLHPVTIEPDVAHTEITIGHAVYTIDLRTAGICVSLSDEQIVLVCESMMERTGRVGLSHVFYASRPAFRRALFSKTGTFRKKRNALNAAQLVDILAPAAVADDDDLFYEDEDIRPVLNLYFRGEKSRKRAQKFLDLMRQSDFAKRIKVAEDPRDCEEKTWLVIDRRGTSLDALKAFSQLRATPYDEQQETPGIQRQSLIVY
ncbi:hypothetical protein VARIO8X_60484 [Burkholderiales bacterium 8X]|nr:hypothetical protein VARIO8X_60484 [Burkholderiales bacterium 8X]